MPEYGIIFKDVSGKTLVLLAENHLSDASVIQSTRRIARGRQFEIWRGNECITGLMGLPEAFDRKLLES